MPTILREGPYDVRFYTSDRNEPAHVHVLRDNRAAKFWLEPVRLQHTGGMRPNEIRRIERMIENNERFLIEAWYDYFNR